MQRGSSPRGEVGQALPVAGRGREVLNLMCPRFFQLLKSYILIVKGLGKRGPVDEKENPATPHVNIFICFLLSFPLCVCVCFCVYIGGS